MKGSNGWDTKTSKAEYRLNCSVDSRVFVVTRQHDSENK